MGTLKIHSTIVIRLYSHCTSQSRRNVSDEENRIGVGIGVGIGIVGVGITGVGVGIGGREVSTWKNRLDCRF